LPDEYQLTFDYDIVAIAASGNDIVVMTKGFPYYVTGSLPETMTQTKLMLPQSCVAKRGVTQVGPYVLYPSPDGYVGIQGGQAKLITEPFFLREQWQSYVPASAVADTHDNMLWVFMDNGNIVFDLTSGIMVTTDQEATGLFEDPEDDRLYMIQGAEITAWGQGATYMTLTWKSKQFQLPRPFEWNTARVFADAYAGNCLLRLYANDVLVTTITVLDEKAHRCPLRRPERFWEVEIVNNAPVNEFSVSHAMERLR
jgi:hypothetical protein